MNSTAKSEKDQSSSCVHNWYTGSLGSRGDYQYPTLTVCQRCGKELNYSADRVKDKITELVEWFHNTGLRPCKKEELAAWYWVTDAFAKELVYFIDNDKD